MKNFKIIGYYFSLLLLIAFTALPSRAVEVTVGDPASATNTNTYPFQRLYGGVKNQILINASELQFGAASFISNIAFDFTTNANQTNMQNFSIKVQNTTLTALTTAFVTDGFTTVFDGPTWATVAGLGWQTIQFTNPFLWDGSSNLLIEICWTNNASNGGTGERYVRTSTTTNNTVSYNRQDAAATCTAITSPSDGVSTARPVMRLEVTPSSAPYITSTPSAIAFGYIPLNTTSTPQTISIGGNNFEPASGDFEITPSEGFEVSIDNGATWSNTLTTLAYVGNPIATPLPIQVRFVPTIDQNYAGTLTIVGGSATKTINLTGTTLLIYCTSNATSTSYNDIGNITIGSPDAPLLNNGSATPLYSNTAANQTYNDFTTTVPPVQLQGGQIYPISVSIINSGTTAYASKINVFIDYNVNGVFDTPQELAFTVPVTNAGTGLTADTWTGSIAVPYDVNFQAVGGPRMRAIVDYSDVAPACGTYTYGETEDYLVQFSDPGSFWTANQRTVSFGFCAPNTISAPQTIQVYGGYLAPTTGDYTITPSAGYEISTDGGTTWTANTVTLAYSGTPFTTPANVQVRFLPTTEELSLPGTLTIEGASATGTIDLTGFSVLEYCVPTITGTTGLDIANITIGEFSNASQPIEPVLSNTESTQTYNDYKATAPVISLQANTIVPYTFNVITSTTAGSTGYLKVFADLNRNSVIDWATERVDSVYFTAANLTANAGLLNGNLNIPVNATVGQNTLIRFVLSTVAAAGPCTSYVNGETEDYWVNFTAPTPFIAATPATKAFGYVAPDSVSAATLFDLGAWSLEPTEGNITVTPSGNFQVSLDSITWSSNPILIPYTNAGASLTPNRILTRFDSPVILGFTSNGTLTISGGTAADRVVTVSAENMQTYPASTVSTTSTTDVLDIAKVTLANVAFGESEVTPITGRTTAINKYTDNRLESQEIELIARNTYTYTANVYTTAATMPACSLSVYIDYNADGDFADTDESVSTVAIPTTTDGVVTGTFTVPVSAVRNTVNSPRIRFVLSSLTPSATSTTYTNGETEDYRVKFLEPLPYVTATPNTKAFGYIASGSSSTAQDIALTAGSLVPATGNITVTPSTNFAVSLDGTTWSTSPIQIPYSANGATITPATVKVRFNSPATLALISEGTLTINAPSLATPLVVSLTGDNMQTYPASTVSTTSTTDVLDIAKVTVANISYGETVLTPITGRTTAVNKYTDNRLAAPTIQMPVSSTYQYTVNTYTSAATMVACSLGVYVDFNADGDFSDPGESVSTVAIPATTNGVVTGTIAVPETASQTAVNSPRMRFVLSTTAPSATSTTHLIGETEDYKVQFLPFVQMTYTSTTTTQVGKTKITVGSVNEKILQVKVTTNNAGNPFTVGSMVFNTNGTYLPSAITNAKVFFTKDTATFTSFTMISDAIASPDGVMTFTPTSPITLVSGDNYFWLTYDVATDASVDARLDAELTGLYLSDAPTVNKITTVQAPAGFSLVSRMKFDGTFGNTTTFPTGWTPSTTYWLCANTGTYPTCTPTSPASMAKYNGYTASAGSSAMLTSPAFSLEGYTFPQTLRLKMYRAAPTDVDDAGSTLQVYIAPTANSTTGATLLSASNAENITSINGLMAVAPVVTTAGWYEYTYDIPAGFGSTNYIIFKGTSDYNNSLYIDDVKFDSDEDAYMLANGVDSISTGNEIFIYNTQNNIVNGFNAKTIGSNNPMTISEVKFTAEGTTNIADVTNAKVWYVGQTLSFDPTTATLFGTAAGITDGEMSVVRTEGEEPITLKEGNNYFAITFDVLDNAIENNYVDCRLTSVTYSRAELNEVVTVANGNTWGAHQIKYPMNGTYTIGGTQLATRWFATLAEATDELNMVGLDADVAFEIAGDQVIDPANPPAIAPLMNVGETINTLTIYPTTNVNITSAYTGTLGMLTLGASDNVTIDGRINLTGEKGLTFTNTAAGRILFLTTLTTGGSVDHAKIQYVNFVGSDKASSAVSLIQINGASHTNIDINHCDFKKAYYGINISGATATTKVRAVRIENNNFGDLNNDLNSIGYTAIALNYVDSLQCNKNSIYNIINSESKDFAAIMIVNDVSNSIFSLNKINKMIQTATYSSAGFNVSSTANSNIIFSNNSISGINSNGTGGITDAPIGLFFNAGGNYKVYHNSVKLEGNRSTVGTSAPSTPSAAIYVASAVTGLDIRNNIFINELTSSVATLKNYGIYCSAPATAFTNLDYNDYFVSGNIPFIGYLTSDRATIADWRTASALDANSKNEKITFVSSLDMHLSGATACNTNLNAPAISSEDVDMDGIVREATTKMGADEVFASLNISSQPTPTINKCIAVGVNNTIIIPGATFETPEYSDNIQRPLIASDLNYSWTKNGEATTYTGVPLSVVYTTIPDASDVYQATVLETNTMLDATTVNLAQGPTVFTLSGTAALCPDATVGTNFTLSGSEAGVQYELMLGEELVGDALIGTGSELVFSNILSVGTYHVNAYRVDNTACSAVMIGTATITVAPVATAFNVTGGGAICAGSTGTHAIGLDASQPGVVYSLYLNGNATEATALNGTGGAISFGTFTAPGTYTVKAVRGTCETIMTGSATITVAPIPTAFAVTGGGVGTSAIGLASSEADVTYTLLKDNAILTPSVTVVGTGSAVSFGTFTEAGTYTAKAARGTCETEMTGSAIVTAAPTGYTLSGTVKYANTAQTAMNNCTVIVKSGTTEVARTTTAANGSYTVTGLANGTYTIEVQTTKAVGGITATDALAMKRHIAGTALLTDLKLKAANINTTGGITATDVLPLRMKIVGQSSTSWRIANYVFSPTTVTIADADATLEIKSLCGGDVNGNFVPSSN